MPVKLQAKLGDVNLRPVLDGFRGEYNAGKQELLIEPWGSNSELLVSRILNSTGQIIVEAVQVPGSVTVRVTEVTLTITMNRTDPGKSTASELSEWDRRKLEEFSRSDASAAVREVLASIIRQKSRDRRAQIMGFLMIAMVLGDGPGAPDVQQSSRRCISPKFVYASYLVPSLQLDTQPIFLRAGKSTMDDCLGCCGPGCWGCTGCYTSACLAHDVCVGEYGAYHPTCMVLLAEAVASMCGECALCIIV